MRVLLTNMPCPRCLHEFNRGRIHAEMIQRLPAGAFAPLADDGSGACCHDCASADTLRRIGLPLDFSMARASIGTDRQRQLRLPGVLIGWAAAGIMQPSELGDLESHHAWLQHNAWFGQDPTEA